MKTYGIDDNIHKDIEPPGRFFGRHWHAPMPPMFVCGGFGKHRPAQIVALIDHKHTSPHTSFCFSLSLSVATIQYSGEEAISFVRVRRKGAIQTRKQVEFVKNFADQVLAKRRIFPAARDRTGAGQSQPVAYVDLIGNGCCSTSSASGWKSAASLALTGFGSKSGGAACGSLPFG